MESLRKVSTASRRSFSSSITLGLISAIFASTSRRCLLISSRSSAGMAMNCSSLIGLPSLSGINATPWGEVWMKMPFSSPTCSTCLVSSCAW